MGILLKKEDKFGCVECQAHFKYKSNLDAHVKAVHAVNPSLGDILEFLCEICKKL